MTVTFHSNADCERRTLREACLCAQFAPNFLRALPEVLQEHADPACAWCHGTGIEERTERIEPTLNVANVNAHALLAFLRLRDDRAYLQGTLPSLRSSMPQVGFTPDPPGLDGHVELPIMRRALLRARNTFDRRAPHFVRETEVLRSARTRDDGTAELVDCVTSGGLSRVRLAEYLTDLEHLCAFAASHRATIIGWS
jgi:hypothetical protein